MVKELYIRKWDFTLYQVDDKIVISVVIFGLVDYHRSFYLLPNEVTNDYESLKELSEKIRNTPDAYKEREVVPAITNETPVS